MALIAPTVDNVGDAALTGSIIDRSITELQDTILTALPDYCFQAAANLKKAVFQHVKSLGASVFYDCANLEVLDFWELEQIGVAGDYSYVFTNCNKLKALIIRTNSVCNITGTDSNGQAKIPAALYVPRDLVDAYKAHSTWSKRADTIYAIEDHLDVCGYLGKIYVQSTKDPGSVSTAAKVYHLGGIWYADTGTCCYYSEDGKNWSDSISALHRAQGSGSLYIYYAGGLWLAYNSNSSKKGVYYSEDGKEWIKSNLTAISSTASAGITCVNGLFFCMADSLLQYSSDGKAWIATNAPAGTSAPVYYDDVGLWLIGSTNIGFWYSDNGIEWVQSNITSNGSTPIFANGILVAGEATAGFYYSEDGRTWVQSNITSAGGIPQYHNGTFVAVNSTSSGGAYYSDDGKVWSKSNIVSYARSLLYANGLWLASSGSSQYSSMLYYSEDGKVWTKSDHPSTNISPKFIGGMFFNTAASLGAYCSIDGKSWSQISSNSGVWVASIGTGFVMCDKTLWYSADGFQWYNAYVCPALPDISVMSQALIYADGIIIGISYSEKAIIYSTVTGE